MVSILAVVEQQVELEAGDVGCVVDVWHGGRLSSVTVAGTELLVTGGAADPPMQWGSFPMVPYAGRVRDGRFTFEGVTYSLPVTLGAHAIHGMGYLLPWALVEARDDHVVLEVDLGAEWPLGGTARQTVSVTPAGVRCTLSVTAGEHPMPAQVGWHPWFRKPRDARLAFSGMYVRDADGIPTGEVVPQPPGPWDDCMIDPVDELWMVVPGHDGPHPTPDVRVALTSDCRHWVVYDQPLHATCVEPQSGPPDGFTLAPEVIAPGQTLSRWMELAATTRPLTAQ